MKKYLFLFILINYSLYADAQGVGVNSDGAVPVAGTMLDVKGASDDNTTYGLQVKDSSGNAIMVVRSDGNVGIGTSSPSSTHHISGSSAAKVSTVTAGSYTAGEETIILANASAGKVTINLPAASTVPDRIYTIKKTDATSDTVVVDANSTETLDGATELYLKQQNNYNTIVSDGSNWFVTASNVIAKGMIVQALFDTTTATVSSSNATWISTGASITIAPTSASSLIRVRGGTLVYQQAPAAICYKTGSIAIDRDGSVLSGSRKRTTSVNDPAAVSTMVNSLSTEFIQQAGTTSAITFRLVFRQDYGGSPICASASFANGLGNDGWIAVEEIVQ